jgi:hypothetical protein
MKTKLIFIVFVLIVVVFVVAVFTSRTIPPPNLSSHISVPQRDTTSDTMPSSAMLATLAPQTPAKLVAITNLVKQLTELKTIPPSALVTNLTVMDETPLLVIYQNTPLANRTALVWALAAVGSNATAKAFIHTLREEFTGKTLVADEGGSHANEEAVMETIVTALGFVASRSDLANDFLHNAIQPEFWQGVATWHSSTGQEIYGLLTSSAVQALGLDERGDISELLQQFRNNPPTDNTVPPHLRRSFAGDVVQAAYYMERRSQIGSPAFHAWFLDHERDVFDADGSYRKWIANGSGASWNQWYQEQIK